MNNDVQMKQKFMLMSNEYSDSYYIYKFLNIESGEIKKKIYYKEPKYVYVNVSESEFQRAMIDNEYLVGNELKFIRYDVVKKYNLIMDREIEVIKVYLKDSYFKLTKNNIIPKIEDIFEKVVIYNNNDKPIEQFNRKLGLILGGIYYFDDNDEPIHIDFKRYSHESLKNYPDYVKDYFAVRLFTEIPSLSKHVLAFDIEIDIPEGIFPIVENAEFPISSIAMVSDEENICYVLTDEVRKISDTKTNVKFKEGWEIKYYESERQMIHDALRFMVDSKYKIIVGYNSDKFDMPYLFQRAETFGLKYDDIYCRIELDKYSNKQQFRFIKGIKNKFLIDLYAFMSNPSIKNYAFKGAYETDSLEDVSQAILGYGKYKHNRWYNKMPSDELAYYNIIDSRLLIDLLKYNDEVIFKLIVMLMRIGNLTMESTVRRRISAEIRNMMEYTMESINALFPNKNELFSRGGITTASNTGKSFKGAYVVDPIKEKTRGIHYDVWAVDYQSLYPSEIKNRNICFTTVNCGHNECKSDMIDAIPHYLCKKRRGFFPSIIGYIRDSRVYYFKKYKKENEQFPIIEQVLKVFINASYGVISSKMFEYFCPPIGETITAYGRYDIKRVMEKAKSDGVKVVYGDTDSAFMSNMDEKYINYLIEWTKENVGLELGVDYVAKFMILYKSKNYIMRIGNKFNVKGMMGKKKNTPEIIKEKFNDVMDLLYDLSFDNEKKIRKKIIEKMKNDINSIRNDDITYDNLDKFTIKQKMLREKYETNVISERLANMLYDEFIKKTQTHVARENIIPKGTILKYVFVINNYDKTDGSTSIMPLEMVNPEMIDREKYIEKYINVMTQITDCFKIGMHDILGQKSLYDWV